MWDRPKVLYLSDSRAPASNEAGLHGKLHQCGLRMAWFEQLPTALSGKDRPSF